MTQLAPVGSDHVCCRPQAGSPAELRKNLTTRVAVFGSAGILRIGQDSLFPAAQIDSLPQRPGSIRIQCDSGLRKTLGQRARGFHFRFAREHAALELEIGKPVAVLCGFGEAQYGTRRQCGLGAQSKPFIRGLGLMAIRQVRSSAVADVEEISQHLYGLALLPFTEQGRHGYLQEFSE